MDVHSRKIKSESHFTKRTNVTESNVNSLSSRKIISNALIVFKFNSEVFGIGYDLSPKIISKSHENPQRERVPHNESNQSRIKIKKTPLHHMAHNVMKRSKTALIH